MTAPLHIKYLTKEIWPEYLAEIYPDLLLHRLDYVQSRIRDGFVFLATKESLNVGFLVYSIWWGNTPFIELIKIKPEYQRQGVGAKLLKAAIGEIKAKNFKRLISSTEAINSLGLQFHEKLGFEKLNSLSLPHGEEQFYQLVI